MSSHILPGRAAIYLAACDAGDPLVVANQLVDEALSLQDAGQLGDAEALLVQAERLLDGES